MTLELGGGDTFFSLKHSGLQCYHQDVTKKRCLESRSFKCNVEEGMLRGYILMGFCGLSLSLSWGPSHVGSEYAIN